MHFHHGNDKKSHNHNEYPSLYTYAEQQVVSLDIFIEAESDTYYL